MHVHVHSPRRSRSCTFIQDDTLECFRPHSSARSVTTLFRWNMARFLKGLIIGLNDWLVIYADERRCLFKASVSWLSSRCWFWHVRTSLSPWRLFTYAMMNTAVYAFTPGNRFSLTRTRLANWFSSIFAFIIQVFSWERSTFKRSEQSFVASPRMEKKRRLIQWLMKPFQE